MKKRLTFGIAAFLLLLVSLVAMGNKHVRAASPNGTSNEVKIDNFSFAPTAVTVAAGTTVTWTNSDDVPHTVVSDDKTFKSKVLDTDEKFSYTFTKPGTYPYFCSIHPKMTAQIVVK
jgi:plastocyanin